MATKGLEGDPPDLGMALTNITNMATWPHTLLASDPWEVPPSYAQINGFEVGMMVPDMLHCWNLGVARDVLGSSLKVILSERIIFDAPRLEDRLMQATHSLRAFARETRQPLRLKKFTKNRLTWKENVYAELVCSGFDAYVIGTWLEKILEPYGREYPEISTLVWSSNKAVSCMYAAGRFYTPLEKENLKALWGVFARTFLHLASKARQEMKFLWRVKPRFHLMCHLFDSHRNVNGSCYSTWMDEDYLRKVSRTLALTAVKSAQHRLLQRWLLSLAVHFKSNLPVVQP